MDFMTQNRTLYPNIKKKLFFWSIDNKSNKHDFILCRKTRGYRHRHKQTSGRQQPKTPEAPNGSKSVEDDTKAVTVPESTGMDTNYKKLVWYIS